MDTANDRRVVRAELTSPVGCSTQLATSLAQLFLSRLTVGASPPTPPGQTAMYKPDSTAAKRCLTNGEGNSLAVCGGRAVDAYDHRPGITQFHHWRPPDSGVTGDVGGRNVLWPVMTATLPSTTPPG